jgi:hypothetical protein
MRLRELSNLAGVSRYDTFFTQRARVLPCGRVIASIVPLASQVANSRLHVLVCKPGTNVFRFRSEEHPEDEPFLFLM